jgi:hypothetical protein
MGAILGSQSSENGCCTEIAAEPLHFRSEAHHTTSKSCVEPAGCVLLHGRRDVAVMVEGRRYRRMPKPLLRELRMYPDEQELCRAAMTKVMEPHPWEVLKSGEEPRKFVRQPLRL